MKLPEIWYMCVREPILWDHLNRDQKLGACQVMSLDPPHQHCKGKWSDKIEEHNRLKPRTGNRETPYEDCLLYGFVDPGPNAPTKEESLVNYDYTFGHTLRRWNNKLQTRREATSAEEEAMRLQLGLKSSKEAMHDAMEDCIAKGYGFKVSSLNWGIND